MFRAVLFPSGGLLYACMHRNCYVLCYCWCIVCALLRAWSTGAFPATYIQLVSGMDYIIRLPDCSSVTWVLMDNNFTLVATDSLLCRAECSFGLAWCSWTPFLAWKKTWDWFKTWTRWGVGCMSSAFHSGTVLLHLQWHFGWTCKALTSEVPKLWLSYDARALASTRLQDTASANKRVTHEDRLWGGYEPLDARCSHA